MGRIGSSPDTEKSGFFDEEEVEDWLNGTEDVGEEKEISSSCSSLEPDQLSEKFAKTQLHIVRTTMDFTLHNLRQSLGESSYIDLAPSYQRRHRWDVRKRSQLIESFLMNIPVPPVFLYENAYNQYEVMDGRQRLEAIRGYLDDEFGLQGLVFWTELAGMKFSHLPSLIQRGLLRRTLSAVVLLAETTSPDERKMDVRKILFQRLNTGGVRLNPQELRNALYPGAFNSMLIELSRSSPFTSIWGILPYSPVEEEDPPKKLINNTLYKTMADCELVLRFFAIRETIQGRLKGPLSILLDKCMSLHQSDTEAEIMQHKELFSRCLDQLNEVFDGRPFILPKTEKPSRPLYDALMVALSLGENRLVASKEKIQSSLEACLENADEYEVLSGGKGSTVDLIRERVCLAKRILFGEGDAKWT